MKYGVGRELFMLHVQSNVSVWRVFFKVLVYKVHITERYQFFVVYKLRKAIMYVWSEGRCMKGGPMV